MNEQTELTERERRLLEEVDRLVANGDPNAREDDSLFGFCAHLASTIPSADPKFEQRLGALLMTRWKERPLALDNKTPSRDRRGVHQASLVRRLSTKALDIRQSLRNFGDRTMKRRLVDVLVAILIAAILTVAFVPAVQAVVVAMIKQVVLGDYSDVRQVEFAEDYEPGSLPDDMWIIQTDIMALGGNAPPGVEPTVKVLDNFEAAQKETGFTLRVPANLPDGYILGAVHLPPIGDMAVLFYSGPGSEIIIIQNQLGTRPSDEPGTVSSVASQIVTNGTVEEIDFDGRPAAWVNEESLHWEIEGMSYAVGGQDLSLEQAMDIGRSLH